MVESPLTMITIHVSQQEASRLWITCSPLMTILLTAPHVVDLTSDLVEQYNCSQLFGERCKVPDHSMISIQLDYASPIHNQSDSHLPNDSNDSNISQHTCNTEFMLPKSYNLRRIDRVNDFMHSVESNN